MSRVIELNISAVADGVTYIVTINEPATGKRQVVEGVVATSEEEAINRVIAILERNARQAMGDTVQVAISPLQEER